jgi:CheY-like chemotaxis protein/vacuolar-type H+-ATPase subunit F/Vma7
MTGQFFFMRVLAVCGSHEAGDLLRQGASVASITVDVSTLSAAAASHALAKDDFDVVFVDSGISEGERGKVIAAARASRHPPFVFVLVPTSRNATDLATTGGTADGMVLNPRRVPEAKALIESCIHLKVPSRLLMVDDSSTMRSIVRKILEACRFPLEISESTDGAGALDRLGAGKFDFVFLDYNMPGLNGFELLTKIKQQYPGIGVVMMTSATDEALAERACAAGAAAFMKKPFFPADIDAIFYSSHGFRALQPAVR